MGDIKNNYWRNFNMSGLFLVFEKSEGLSPISNEKSEEPSLFLILVKENPLYTTEDSPPSTNNICPFM